MRIKQILKYSVFYLAGLGSCYALKQSQSKPLPEHVANQPIAYSNAEAGHLKSWNWPRIRFSTDLLSQKIIPPQDQAYLGVFANDYTDTEHLACFERMTGSPAGQADISLRFISLGGIVEGQTPFPLAEAERMHERGGALYLVLEPGENRGRLDNDFSLENLNRGMYDEQLEEFAAMARHYGGPIFISLRPTINAEAQPETLKDAYIYLHNILTTEGATNVTWVWHVNLDEPDAASNYPGNENADWIATSLFNTNGESPEQTIARFNENIQPLKALGRPIIIEFGSDADQAIKERFFNQVLSRFQDEGINAAVFYNVSSSRGDRQQNWALLSPAEQEAFQAALAGTGNYFTGNILTNNGESLRSSTPPDRLDCSLVNGHYYNFSNMRRIAEIRREIDNINIWVTHERDFNLSRIRVAQLLTELARLEPTHEEQHLAAAISTMDSISADEHFRYHISAEYVRDYFDASFQIADMLLQNGNVSRATTRYEKILEELRDENILLAQQIHSYSIPGFRSRANLELAYIHLSQNNINQARPLLESIKRWAQAEAAHPTPILLYRGETRNDLLFLEARAALGLARIALTEGRYNDIFPLAAEVTSMEAAGSESGFMDLTFEALLICMQASLRSSHALAEAKEKFERGLPWERINSFHDLKVSFDCEDTCDFTNPGYDRWDMILRGLTNVQLTANLQERRLNVMAGTEILSRN